MQSCNGMLHGSESKWINNIQYHGKFSRTNCWVNTHCERKHIYGLFISNLKTWTTKEEIYTYYKYYKKNINKTLAEETDEIGGEQTWDPELIYCFLNFRGLGYLGILYHSLHMTHFTNILVNMLNM